MTLEGVTFDGYRLVRLLGRGGAGEVYLAETPAYGSGAEIGAEHVAIKVFPDTRGEAVAHELLREAQQVAALGHPNILPCYGDTAQGNDLAIVMAYAPGGSLGGDSVSLPLRPAVVALIVSQVADVLTDLHARGLTHGDLKPNNLFVRAAPGGGTFVVLSDFGQGFLARAAVTAIRQDQSGEPPEWAIAQLAWAAPEQLRGDAVPASDQYSLAALAYHLLTGIWPVSAEAQSVLNSSRSPQPIAPPSRLNPTLDDEVDATIFYALSPRPEHRFDSIAEFAQALEDALVGSGPASGPVRAAPGVGAGSPESTPAKRTLGQMSHRVPVVVNDADLERYNARERDWDDWDDAGHEADLVAAGGARATRRRGSRGWRVTIVTTLMLALALVVGTLGVLAFNPGMRPFQLHLDLPTLTKAIPSPTAQPTTTPSPEGQAEARFRAALTHAAAYSDALTGKPATWATSGKSIFFGSDQRLHLNNTGKTPLFEDVPKSATIPQGAYVATVDVALAHGKTSDHVGMRFLVSSSSKGDTYYSYLITPDARFELWAQQPDTGLIFQTSGYVASLKTGIGQSNTLAVLVDPASKTLTLFANGAFVFQTPIATGVALNGRLGVLTPDSGVEATFSRFAIYSA